MPRAEKKVLVSQSAESGKQSEKEHKQAQIFPEEGKRTSRREHERGKQYPENAEIDEQVGEKGQSLFQQTDKDIHGANQNSDHIQSGGKILIVCLGGADGGIFPDEWQVFQAGGFNAFGFIVYGNDGGSLQRIGRDGLLPRIKGQVDKEGFRSVDVLDAGVGIFAVFYKIIIFDFTHSMRQNGFDIDIACRPDLRQVEGKVPISVPLQVRGKCLGLCEKIVRHRVDVPDDENESTALGERIFFGQIHGRAAYIRNGQQEFVGGIVDHGKSAEFVQICNGNRSDLFPVGAAEILIARRSGHGGGIEEQDECESNADKKHAGEDGVAHDDVFHTVSPCGKKA